MAKKRPNIVPIIEDARHPLKYRMLVPMVDVIFADVAQPDQARIVAYNAEHFLKPQGNFVISVKASCIDSTAQPEAVFAQEVNAMQKHKLKPKEQVRCPCSAVVWGGCGALLCALWELALCFCSDSPSWSGRSRCRVSCMYNEHKVKAE